MAAFHVRAEARTLHENRDFRQTLRCSCHCVHAFDRAVLPLQYGVPEPGADRFESGKHPLRRSFLRFGTCLIEAQRSERAGLSTPSGNDRAGAIELNGRFGANWGRCG